MGSDPALAEINTDVPEPVSAKDPGHASRAAIYTVTKARTLICTGLKVTPGPYAVRGGLGETLEICASLLDSVIAVYSESGGSRELIARNDDYFNNDFFSSPGVGVGARRVLFRRFGCGECRLQPGGRVYPVLVVFPRARMICAVWTFRPQHGNCLRDADSASTRRGGRERDLQSTTGPLDGDGDGEPLGAFTVFRGGCHWSPSDGQWRHRQSKFALQHDCLGVVSGSLVGGCGADHRKRRRPWGTWARRPTTCRTKSASICSAGRWRMAAPTLPQGVICDRGGPVVLSCAALRSVLGSYDATTNLSGGALQVLCTPRLVDNAGFLPGSGRQSCLGEKSRSLRVVMKVVGRRQQSVGLRPLRRLRGWVSAKSLSGRRPGRPGELRRLSELRQSQVHIPLRRR